MRPFVAIKLNGIWPYSFTAIESVSASSHISEVFSFRALLDATALCPPDGSSCVGQHCDHHEHEPDCLFQFSYSVPFIDQRKPNRYGP